MASASEQIQKLLETKSLPQAILFSGNSGSSTIEQARQVAKSLLASENLDSHPDFISASGNSVDDVRRILSALVLKSFGNRVVVLEQAENLSPEAANNLLKNIEEPNAGTYFIVTTSHEEKLLPTLRSRLMTFRFQDEGLQAADELLAEFVSADNLARRLDAARAVAEREEGAQDFLKQLYTLETNNFKPNTPTRLEALLQSFQYLAANVAPARVLQYLALKW